MKWPVIKKNLLHDKPDGRRSVVKSLVLTSFAVLSGTSLLSLLNMNTGGPISLKTRLILIPSSPDLSVAIEQFAGDFSVINICPEAGGYAGDVVRLRNDFINSGRLLDFKKYKNDRQLIYESTWTSSEDLKTFVDSPQLQGTFAAYKRRGFMIHLEVVS